MRARGVIGLVKFRQFNMMGYLVETFLIIKNISHQTEMIFENFRNLAEILSERESISKVMQDSLDEATDPWGVKAERVEM